MMKRTIFYAGIFLLFFSCLMFSAIGSPCEECEHKDHFSRILRYEGYIDSVIIDLGKIYVFTDDNGRLRGGSEDQYTFYNATPSEIKQLQDADIDKDDKEIIIFYEQMDDGRCYINSIDLTGDDGFDLGFLGWIIALCIGIGLGLFWGYFIWS